LLQGLYLQAFSGSKVKVITNTLRKARHTISRYGMIRHSERVIVAVSGGADSVCLLDLLHKMEDELEIQLVVAHFDHGLRPDVDEVETQYTKSLAASLNLPFETEKAGAQLRKGGSLEERARVERYRFLEQTKEKHSAHKIATGHNRNDQAETVLMRLLRGSGPSGLSGIPPCRDDTIIRPLIEITRGEIETYLKGRGLRHVTDVSNLESHYLRNRVRLELIPELERYQPRIVEILGQMSNIMRSDDERLATEAEAWLKHAARSEEKETRIPVHIFTMLPEALKSRVIRYILKETGGTLRRIGFRHIDAILQIAKGEKPQAQVKLPNAVIVKRVYNELFFTGYEDVEAEDFCCTIPGPGRFPLRAIGCSVLVEEVGNVGISNMKTALPVVFLDADHLAYPLMVRNFRPGDRFVPLGMTGHRKLKDFFIDLKVPSETRRRTPILIYRDIPIWVCGFRIDDRFKVTSRTKRALKVTLVDN
jgi:tRNA(Ile)-lysidine synthase